MRLDAEWITSAATEAAAADDDLPAGAMNHRPAIATPTPENCPGHPPASTLKACACRTCGAWIWEHVSLCTNLVGETGVCTRPMDHDGSCEERELRGGEVPT
jgi:hypothetical protein